MDLVIRERYGVATKRIRVRRKPQRKRFAAWMPVSDMVSLGTAALLLASGSVLASFHFLVCLVGSLGILFYVQRDRAIMVWIVDSSLVYMGSSLVYIDSSLVCKSSLLIYIP
jgi:hypothetical protein